MFIRIGEGFSLALLFVFLCFLDLVLTLSISAKYYIFDF